MLCVDKVKNIWQKNKINKKIKGSAVDTDFSSHLNLNSDLR